MADEPNRMKPDEDDEGRSPFAMAMQWTSRVTGISLEMVLPALFGHWLDQRWGTRGLFLLMGVTIGFFTALMSLIHLGKSQGRKP